ncbi:MAG: ATP-binding cassette domain-containing protein [Syntrophobacteraceae bacterium]
MELSRLSEYVLYTEDVTKRFGVHPAVADLNLKVGKGEIFGLVGSDGAGKTTTVQMLCGILAPDAGLIFVDGHEVESEPDAVRSIVGYMSQDFTLYLDMTVDENIDFMADLRGVSKADKERRKQRLLEFSRMEPFRSRRAGALSGGMKKKLALSCALIHHPEILILDEPTTAVDPLSRTELWRILYEFSIEGITIIVTTPYMDEAERCTRVALMQDGRVISCDSPSELRKQVRKKVCLLEPDDINRASRTLREELSISGQVYGHQIRIFLDNPEAELPKVREALRGKGIALNRFMQVSPTMDDVFMDMLTHLNGTKKKKAWVTFSGATGNDKAVAVSSLTKKFGAFTAVKDVSFEVQTGMVFGLLGANGAGKTTIIKMLCGLLPPTSGNAVVAGYDTARHSRMVKGKVGYMAQLFSLYPDLTVRQNLDFFAGVYGLSKKDKKIKLDWVLELADLKEKQSYLTRELAGGWKQKLALGCAVMHQPAVLFLDEPTSGVDPPGRSEFWDAIQRFSEEGVTTIVTTHFMDEAERCDTVGFMNTGNMIAMGSPGELKKNLAVEFYEVSSDSPSKTYEKLMTIESISRASLFGNKIHIQVEKGRRVDVEYLRERDSLITGLEKITPSLEDVFVYHIMTDNRHME